MKKILFFAAAAIMMVGCSSDQVVSEMPQDNAINFGMYFGRDAQSRAAIMKTEDLHEPEMEYCRCKKTNPLVSLPGFVNMFSDYSNISLPNCSGR